MLKRLMFIICISIIGFGFTASEKRELAVKQIHQLKKGVLLVRLHQHNAVLDKLKLHGKDVEHKRKKEEIEESNKSIYESLSRIYDFSKIEFFYAEDSKKVRQGDFKGIFLNDALLPDSTIVIDTNLPRYILEVGDIIFANISGHQDGLVVLNDQFEPLESPFPYYIKRSGGFFIKRTDTDMAMLLNNQFNTFYNKYPVN